MNVNAYIRVSTLTQARDGESWEAQRSQVINYAASKRLNLLDGNVYIAEAISTGAAMMDQSIDITDRLKILPLSKASHSISNPRRLWCFWIRSSTTNIALIVECQALANIRIVSIPYYTKAPLTACFLENCHSFHRETPQTGKREHQTL